MSIAPALVETGARPSLGTLGISPEAKPVEELTPGCVLEVRIPASAFSDGFFCCALFVARCLLRKGGAEQSEKKESEYEKGPRL
jgi:hypothetical protein